MKERLSLHSVALNCALALLFVAVALFVSLLLRNTIPHSFAIFLLVAVAASAWCGGVWPGLFAVAVSSLGAAYFFFPPLGSLFVSRQEMPYFGLFVGTGAGIAWIISARREAEETQRTYLDELLNTTADAVAMISLDDRVVRVNKEFSRMFGYAPGEVAGRSLNDLIVPEGGVREAQEHSERIARGEIVNVETIRQSKDGSHLEIALLRVPISAGVGRIASYSIYRDITASKRAEEALRKSEEKFYKTFRESPLTISLTSMKDYRYIEVNDTFERLTGYTREEVIGKTPFDMEMWVDPSQRMELTRRLLTEGSLREIEARFRAKDGRIWIGLSSVELIEIDNEPCSLFITLDITERKWAEQALRESEERFRVVANSAPMMIWMSGVDKLCTYFNQSWLDFTGRPLDAELGNGWTEGIHPEDFAKCLEIYVQSFDRRQPFRMEYRLRRYDGEYRWILDIGVPMTTSDGSFCGFIGSCVDVTDRKKAEEALSRVSGRLIEAQEQERHRIARELHDDINQRLALLANGLQFLDEIPADSPELHSRVKQLLTQTWDLSSDVHALSHELHSSKLESLGTLAALRSFCRELAEKQRVTIDFEHSNVPDSVPPEASLCLFRILQEGLRNAVKYSGEQHFEVRLRGMSGKIELTIRDFGVGFDVEKVSSHGGLGLISMRERVALVKGTLSITSGPSRGTEIRVVVPVVAGTHEMELGASA